MATARSTHECDNGELSPFDGQAWKRTLHPIQCYVMASHARVLLVAVVFCVCICSNLVLGEEQCSSSDGETCSTSDVGCGCSASRPQSEKKNGGEDASEDASVKYKSPREANGPYDRTNQMVYIPGGSFTMGTDQPVFPADGEQPARKVKVNPFFLDKYEVSNAEFELFVKSTDYKTEVRPI